MRVHKGERGLFISLALSKMSNGVAGLHSIVNACAKSNLEVTSPRLKADTLCLLFVSPMSTSSLVNSLSKTVFISYL